MELMLKRTALILHFLLQLVLGASTATAAIAPCTIAQGINFAPVVGASIFPSNAPIGAQSPPYSTTVSIECVADGTSTYFSIYTYAPGATAIPGFTNYYQTNIPDIAVRYIAEQAPGTTACSPYSGGWPSQMLTITRTIKCTMQPSPIGEVQQFNLKYTAYFMKVGNATVGNLTTIPQVTIQEYWPVTATTVDVFSGAASGTFAIGACSVTTPSIAVTMPRTYMTKLPNIGSTDGETSLNIGLNCDAGLKVLTTLTDATNPSNTSQTLSLSPDSSSEGIAYQILYNGMPVTFGADSAVAGNPGQFLVTPSQTVGGTLNVPLTARYIRTGPIRAGTANAKATFTMSYQ
jgi:type 1 fimbria pilin